MLVLSRKKCQRIRLGDSIVLTIDDIGGDRVKLGIEAPSEVQVTREELTENMSVKLPFALKVELPDEQEVDIRRAA